MRAAATLVLVLLGGCARPLPVTAPVSPTDLALAVITWNTHAGEGDLPRLLDDLASGRLAGAPLLEYVLLLQEATVQGDGDVRALARARGLSSFVVPVREFDDRESGNAILSTRPLSGGRVIDLPRERQQRVAAAAAIEIDGQPLFVVSVHLENRLSLLRGAVFSDGARERQADAVIRALPATGTGIAGGDLNTFLGRGEGAWSAFAARFDDTPAAPPEPTFRDRLTLDHLFFDLPDGWTAAVRVVPEQYNSDHNPVLGIVTRARQRP